MLIIKIMGKMFLGYVRVFYGSSSYSRPGRLGGENAFMG